jgi:hypothetical protein
MSPPAFWLGLAALVGADYGLRVWTDMRHQWVAHSVGSVAGAVALAWGVWLVAGRFAGPRPYSERRSYVVTVALLILMVFWIARRHGP